MTVKSFDIMMVGPVSHDIIVVEERAERIVGGGVWCAAFPTLSMGLKVGLATRLARTDFGLLGELEEAGGSIFPVEAFETTSIRNVYSDSSMERRVCTVEGCSAALLPEDLPDVNAKVWYAGGLMRGDVPLETVRRMHGRGALCVDLQGYLRYRQQNELLTGPFGGLEEVVSLTTYLKADLAEAEIATGTADPVKASAILAGWGALEVLITGDNQVHVRTAGQFMSETMDPRSMAGRTGRGDTCTATYVGARVQGLAAAEALKLCAAVTSRKMEVPGPYRGPVPPQ